MIKTIIPFIAGVVITASVAFTSNVKEILQVRPATPKSIIVKEYIDFNNFDNVKSDILLYSKNGYIVKSLSESGQNQIDRSWTLVMEKY